MRSAKRELTPTPRFPLFSSIPESNCARRSLSSISTPDPRGLSGSGSGSGSGTGTGTGTGTNTRIRPIHDLSRREAFTLIELMVVVIVLGILAATIVPQFIGVSHDAKVTRAQSDIATLETQLERFHLNMDRYPTTQEGLEVLVTPPAESEESWRGPYIKELIPDPWSHPYQYRSPGQHGSRTYDLWSNGPDGQPGGDGQAEDITNWTKE